MNVKITVCVFGYKHNHKSWFISYRAAQDVYLWLSVVIRCVLFLVKQPSRWGRESWLLLFVCPCFLIRSLVSLPFGSTLFCHLLL